MNNTVSVPPDIYNAVEPYVHCPDPIWEGIVYFESGFSPQAIGDNDTSFGLFQLHLGGQADSAISWIINQYGLSQAGAIQYLLAHPAVQAQFGMTAINYAWQQLGSSYSPLSLDWWIQFCSLSGHPGGSASDPVTVSYAQNFINKVVQPNLFNIQMLNKNSSGSGNNVTTISISGKSNTYPPGQCTYYADERYHQLTGLYVPWSGDAYQWSSLAPNYGWEVSSSPVVPSIICLQPGVQLADLTYGHVGVVESINSDGSVVTSDLNWGIDAVSRSKVTSVTFQPGTGVTFIYAVDSNNNPVASSSILSGNGGTSNSSGIITALLSVSNNINNALQAINTLPGFEGICVGLDKIEQFRPFTLVVNNQTNNQNEIQQIIGDITGIVGLNPTLPQVVSDSPASLVPDVIQSGIIFISSNMLAFFLRAIMVIIGLFILYALFINLTTVTIQETLSENGGAVEAATALLA